jgi:tetratricopeptide (TPR) repeat protein
VQALKASAGDDRWQGVLGPTLAYQGLLYFRKGQYDKARQCYEDSIAILRKVGDPRPLAEALVFLAIISYLTGEYVEAKSLLEEGLVCAQAGDDRWIATYATFNLGYVASLMGDYALGYEQMLAGLTAWRTLEDPHSISLGLNFLVPTLIKLGRYEEANAFLQESIALCEESNDRWGMGTAYRFFGIASLSQGSYSEAQAYLRKSLEVFDEFVVGWDIARTRSYLGDALQLAGNLSEARQTYMSALQQSMAAQAIPIALDVMAGLAQLHARAGNSESALELSYVVLNHPASTQDAKDRILPFFKNLEAQPTLEQVETVEGRTRSDSFELIVEELLEAQS